MTELPHPSRALDAGDLISRAAVLAIFHPENSVVRKRICDDIRALPAPVNAEDACPSCGGSGHYGDAARLAMDVDPITAAQVQAEPVAWQWNARPIGSATWHGWRDGRKPKLMGRSYEVIERPLYAIEAPVSAAAGRPRSAADGSRDD